LLKRFLAIRIDENSGQGKGKIVGSAGFHRYTGKRDEEFSIIFCNIDQKWAGQGFQCINTNLEHHKISQ